MDNNFWEYREEDKVMQDELESFLSVRVDTHVGSYTSHGDYYRTRIVNGLGDTVYTCFHKHRREMVAQLCGEVMIERLRNEELKTEAQINNQREIANEMNKRMRGWRK